MALKAGDEAPDFELRSHKGGTVKLSDFRGRRTWCSRFIRWRLRRLRESDVRLRVGPCPLRTAGAAVLGISIDAQPAKAAWAKTLGPISYDLLSDFHPHGEVAERYGVFRPKEGSRSARSSSSTRRGRWPGPRCTRSPSSRQRKCLPRSSDSAEPVTG